MSETTKMMTALEAHYRETLTKALRGSPVRVSVCAENDIRGERSGEFTLFLDGGTNEENLAAQALVARALHGLTEARVRRIGHHGKAVWWTTDSVTRQPVARRRGLKWVERLN